MRHEFAVATPLSFSSGVGAFGEEQTAVIHFDGRRFVWHARRVINGSACSPVVTSLHDTSRDDSSDEHRDANGLLSALSYLYDQPMWIVASAATGFKEENGLPILFELGHEARIMVKPPCPAYR